MVANIEKREIVYRYLVEFIKENGYPPTMQEICDGVGFRSKQTVSYYLNWLKADGIISYQYNKPRTITLGGTDDNH